jgi:5-methylcytosine-specific restriction enzyme subunit McrC
MVISLAQLLLGGRFQTADAGQHHGFALVFDMGKLFERYVGKLIVRSLHGLDVNVCLQGPRDYLLDVLDEDQRGEKTRSFMTQPDIVVRKHGVPVLIADTKWKRLSAGTEDAQHDIKESDVHQMLAYAHVYDVSRLLLLYPHHPNLNSTDELLVSRHVRGTVDRRLYAATLSLCGGARVTQRLTHLALTFGLSADGAETAQNIASAAS